jgi:CelD/BcsL family acetyltransferase involved in cellulose biosynthesis
VRAELVGDEAALEPFRAGWDRLAVELGRPFCSPAWMLAWWRHAAPDGAVLRTVVVLHGEEVAGVAPFFEANGRLRLLAVEASLGVELVARRGDEAEVARAVAEALADVEPHLIRLEGARATPSWPRLLTGAWPGRGTWSRQELDMPSPVVILEGTTFDEWLALRSSHFRTSLRRNRRRLDEGGAVFHVVAGADLERGLGDFAELHHSRWRARGGSGVLTPGVEKMLPEVARELAPENRFRLYTVEIEERVIAADICVSAGGETSWWLTGHDDEWGRSNPTMVNVVAAIEHSFASGERRFDLGGGRLELKSRLTDQEDTLEWTLLVPRGRRYALTRLQLLPGQLRRGISERLSPETKARVKRLLRRA